MRHKPEKRVRRSIRLKEYDYTRPGVYFVTVCTQGRRPLFGDIVDGVMRLNSVGDAIQMVWNELPRYYLGVMIDQFVVMPNHVHGVIVLVGAGPRACPDAGQPQDEAGCPQGGTPTLSLPDVVHRFKSLTTARCRQGDSNIGFRPLSGRLWQRNYYEHVIRDEVELNLVRKYIINNPLQWILDRENPVNENVPGKRDEPWCV